MNLNDFRTRVARAVGMSTGTTADTDLIDAWANEAVEQFLVETKTFTQTASLAVTADSGDYLLDTDILAFKDVYYNPATGDSLIMEPTSSKEITRMRLFTGTTDVAPRFFSLEGSNLLRLYPLPASSSDTIHMIYVPRPSSTLSATADTPSATAYGGIPVEYHPVLEAYVKWKAGEAEEHRASDNGLRWNAEWERGLAMVRAKQNMKDGVWKGKKVGGRKPGRYGYSPGVDLG